MYTQKGKIDQNELVKQYIPMVRRQALSLQVRLPSNIELDDLIQSGYIGLLDAMTRFDESSGATFQTFATARVRGAMIDELRTRDWLPRSVRRKSRSLVETINQLEQTLGRSPTEREIIAKLDMSPEDYYGLLNDTNNGLLLPLEQLAEEGWEPHAGFEDSDLPFSDTLYHEQRDSLIKAIEALPDREKLLLALYYQEELNLKEIGSIMGVSESRVCQLHSQAIARIRSRFRINSVIEA